ncbi:MAG: TRAP transporter substrate-binding protein [Betaproteobacteria bacterium]|nr:TRAP transporter substrate-binding protein [Betaproteobacteria bacterium]
MNRRRSFIAATAAAALAFATGPALAQTKWDMPTPYPDGNFHTKNVVQFTQDVAKATGGKLEIVVHSNGSLIKMPEIKRAVQTGQVPIGEILGSVLANESALFAFDSNPFLANSYAKERRLWHIARPYIEKKLAAQGIELLYSVPWPPQGIYTKKPIQSIADLKGIKFRTYSPTTSRFAELLGAVPTTVQVPDIPQAFKTGLVDAMITSGATGVDSQAWDYLSYYYDTQAFLPQNMVLVNKAAFDKLPAAERSAVLKAARAAETRGWKVSEEENGNYVKTMASHGIKIEKPSRKLEAEFEAIGKQMAEEWAKKAGPEGEAILKAYRGGK